MDTCAYYFAEVLNVPAHAVIKKEDKKQWSSFHVELGECVESVLTLADLALKPILTLVAFKNDDGDDASKSNIHSAM